MFPSIFHVVDARHAIRERSAAPASPAQANAPLPGAYFGLPGLTQWTEQKDNNDGVVTALSQTNQVNASAIVEFKQTDVVFWWEIDVAWTNTVTPGTSAITTSPYFPYNIYQQCRLQIQNMYPALHCLSGIDLAIWQLYRPMRGNFSDKRNNLDVNTAGLANTGSWANANMPQANLVATPNNLSTTAAIAFSLELPVSVFFDVYFDIMKDGSLVAPPQRAIVSPQYMAGSARVIQPDINFAAGSVSNLDNGPFNIGAGTGTYAGSVKQGFTRRGVYASNNPALLPVVYNWQYIRDAKQYSLAGVSAKDILVPTYGQILSVFLRFWDPSANGGLGAAIAISSLTRAELQFGSGLYRFQDTPLRAQRRFIRQHGTLPPVGVLIWDMAIDDYGRLTNGMALNTLTTAGVNVHLEFASALSATAYVVMGVEALSYVE